NLIPAAPAGLPPTAEEYVAQGLAYYRARDFEAAAAMSQRAIALRPELAEAYNNLGAAYCELGRWRDAIVPLQTALRLKPDFTLARNNLRWALDELQKAPPAGPGRSGAASGRAHDDLEPAPAVLHAL